MDLRVHVDEKETRWRFLMCGLQRTVLLQKDAYGEDALKRPTVGESNLPRRRGPRGPHEYITRFGCWTKTGNTVLGLKQPKCYCQSHTTNFDLSNGQLPVAGGGHKHGGEGG
jgi:hypothetical protein